MSLELEEETLNKMYNLHFPDYVLKMKEYAHENNVPIIQDEGLSFLLSMIRATQPKSILEIGTAIGYSASMMVLSSNACVTTIERDEKMHEESLKNVKALDLESKIRLIYKDALLALDDVSDQKYDIIFIDAAKAQYTNFFNLYSPLLTDKGIIITDNMLFHGVKLEDAKTRALRGLIRKLNNYTDFLLNHPDFETTIFNLGDGMALSTKRH